MKYFLDTEFIEYPGTIDLISVGIVNEKGKKAYAINRHCDLTKASTWVIKNVLQGMREYNHDSGTFKPDHPNVIDAEKMRSYILKFIGDDKNPEFWGYYSSYDWTVFCWIFGRMIDLPKGFPMYCRDLKQLLDEKGNPKIPFEPDGEHNALNDAGWNKKVHEWIKSYDN